MSILQISASPNFYQKAKAIREQASSILESWGLVPRFKRWRLSKDPETGMIVLFGILNNQYIARHTQVPFSNYFDTYLMHDLANKLRVQIVSGNNGGLGYAFILSRGQIDLLPTQLEVSLLNEINLSPFFVNDWTILEVVEGEFRLSQRKPAAIIDYDQTLIHHCREKKKPDGGINLHADKLL